MAENIQRNSLSAIEEARCFRAYISDDGWGGATQLAMKLGKSVSYVTKRMASLDLPTDVVTSINNSAVLNNLVGIFQHQSGSEFDTIKVWNWSSGLSDRITTIASNETVALSPLLTGNSLSQGSSQIGGSSGTGNSQNNNGDNNQSSTTSSRQEDKTGSNAS